MARTKRTPTQNRPDARRGEKRPKKILPEKASRPHVYRPSEIARREIRKFQKSTKLLLPLAAVSRVAREIKDRIAPGFRFRVEAVDTLHHASEDYLVKLLIECNALAPHADHITVMPKTCISHAFFEARLRFTDSSTSKNKRKLELNDTAH